MEMQLSVSYQMVISDWVYFYITNVNLKVFYKVNFDMFVSVVYTVKSIQTTPPQNTNFRRETGVFFSRNIRNLPP